MSDSSCLRPFLDDAWRRAAGASVDDLYRTEWSPEFEGLMRRRLIVGAYRYGCLGALGKLDYDRVASIRRRLGEYERTGNLELLVDCANLRLVEFVDGRHPGRHFAAADDGEHAEEKK